MNDIRKIKQLQSQLKKLIDDAEILKIDFLLKQKEYNEKKKLISDLEKIINDLNNKKELKVSEHAILRYLERVKGINIGEIEKEILSENVRKMVDVLGGSGKFPNNGYQVVLKDYIVTTVM